MRRVSLKTNTVLWDEDGSYGKRTSATATFADAASVPSIIAPFTSHRTLYVMGRSLRSSITVHDQIAVSLSNEVELEDEGRNQTRSTTLVSHQYSLYRAESGLSALELHLHAEECRPLSRQLHTRQTA